MAIRTFDVCIITLVGGVEYAWTPPNGLSIMDFQKDNADVVRLSFAQGGTADGSGDENGGGYFEIDPDWWNSGGKEICLSSNATFYLYCAVNNVVRVLVGVE